MTVISTTTIDHLCPSLSKNRFKVTDKDKQNVKSNTNKQVMRQEEYFNLVDPSD